LTFEDTQGIFLRMAREANLPHNQDNSYYLIIDEINRGVLSRIFGELILSLEYRDLPVHLPGQSEPLVIPKNLYLIGTMNTADRNIALVDHALRRRFLMHELLPDIDVLHSYDYESESLRNKALNAFEIVHNLFYDGKNNAYRTHNGYAMKDYAVGHTYFLAKNDRHLEIKINNQVIPLLAEYQREGVISEEDLSIATAALQSI
jgi:5-methylcytosine-specific restriction protein B